MLQTEYVRNLNSNYERILLDKKPEENRYQYCIMSRGGIKRLLPCSLRYINGQAYLYYDITSTQNVEQLYARRSITREWMKDFLWNMQQVKQELGRFLLDDRNVVWHPEQIFQDLEKNDFFFLYIPYYEGECGFLKLIEYWVEHIDYEDDTLVEFVYRAHEQFELLGSIYLQEQIFDDGDMLNGQRKEAKLLREDEKTAAAREIVAFPAEQEQKKMGEYMAAKEDEEYEEKRVKKGILALLEGKRKKQREERLRYAQDTRHLMENYIVCENAEYEKQAHMGGYEGEYDEEEFGRTICMEEGEGETEKKTYRLCTREGRTLAEVTHMPFVVGKRKEETDCSINDSTVSRIHARIIEEGGKIYLEDLNSTNGTYKNGLLMQPYEKRLLEEGDEIRLGKAELIFR